MMIEESRAYRYAKWCIGRNNRKVGRYVKLQAKRWLKIADGKHKSAYVSEKAYRKICRLLKLMVHPDLSCSMYEGLEDYAWFLVTAVFCTRRRADNRRFYQTALLEIARKNFKTFNSAVIFLLGMLTEPRFSRFFSVAPDYKLSSELRLAVRKIIKVSPALTEHFKVNRDMITCLINEIEYTPLAYSNDGMDGRLANLWLADEAGALDSYPVEAMRSSQITLPNKLGIIISTQYPNDIYVMIDEIDIAKKVLDGLLEKEDVFALLYEPDDALPRLLGLFAVFLDVGEDHLMDAGGHPAGVPLRGEEADLGVGPCPVPQPPEQAVRLSVLLDPDESRRLVGEAPAIQYGQPLPQAGERHPQKKSAILIRQLAHGQVFDGVDAHRGVVVLRTAPHPFGGIRLELPRRVSIDHTVLFLLHSASQWPEGMKKSGSRRLSHAPPSYTGSSSSASKPPPTSSSGPVSSGRP